MCRFWHIFFVIINATQGGNDMKISIYSRKEIEKLIENDFPKNTAVISFYDPAGIRSDNMAPVDYHVKAEILSLGVYAVFCMYFTVVVFYYFTDYNAACISFFVFLIVTVLSSTVTAFTNKFYPLPLLLGGLCGWIVSFVLLQHRMKNLDSFLMC